MKLDWYAKRPVTTELSFKIPVSTYSFDTTERRAFLPTPPRNIIAPNSRDMRERLAAIYIDDELRKMREKEQRSKTKAANIQAALKRQDDIILELQGGRAANVAAIDAVRAEFPNVVGAVNRMGDNVLESTYVTVGSAKAKNALRGALNREPSSGDLDEIRFRLSQGRSVSGDKEYPIRDIITAYRRILRDRFGSASFGAASSSSSRP